MLASVLLAAAVAAPPALDVDALLARADGRPMGTWLPTTAPSIGLSGDDPLVVYMNRFGGTYVCDDDDARSNRSSIACAEPTGVAHVGAFSGSDAQWAQIMSCVTDMYAPFRLAVTDVEPMDREYVESVVGGAPNEAGMSSGVGGVAPFACAVIPYAVVYTFSELYGDDVQGICETVAQEVAHAFGLDHAFLCSDPMTYLPSCGDKSFQDEWAACGEYEPRECSCGGTTQNSVQQMTQLFGPADGSLYVAPDDRRVPEVALLSPETGAILGAGTTITVQAEALDDVGLTVVELEWDFTGEPMFCPSEGGSYSCARDGDTYTWRISVGQGMRSFRVHVRDGAGNDATTETREVWLSTDGLGPPRDVAPPTILVGAPLDGDVVASAPYDIVATILDDVGIAAAALQWRRFGAVVDYPCPYESERVSCVVEGATYRWTMHRAREGERRYEIRAVDALGKATISDTMTFVVDARGDEVERGGDESFDGATPLACGETRRMDGTDADWFAVDAPPTSRAVLTVDSDDAVIVASDGAEARWQEGGAVEVPSGAPWRVGVAPATAVDGVIEVTLTCELPVPPSPPDARLVACSAAGAPAPVVLLLALLSRRRARR